MGQSNIELAREGYAAMSRGDLEALAELLDPEVKWHGGNPDDEYACHNRQQALAWMRRRPARRAGPLPELIDVVEAGDRVVLIMQPAPSAEDPQPQRTANLTTIRDGKVVEMVHYADAAAALAALGPTA